jgi:hypothetical protein
LRSSLCLNCNLRLLWCSSLLLRSSRRSRCSGLRGISTTEILKLGNIIQAINYDGNYCSELYILSTLREE